MSLDHAKADLPSYKVGQRISSNEKLGTIKYCGRLSDSDTIWLGIEWDNVSMGKHSGIYQGKSIFECAPGHGTFLKKEKVNLKFDKPASFFEALVAKYTHTELKDTIRVRSITRPVQLIGFEQAADHYSEFRDATVLAVPHNRIDRLDIPRDLQFTNLSQLDLSWNLIQSADTIAQMCHQMPKLASLKLEGNYLEHQKLNCEPCETVRTLSLNFTAMTWSYITELLDKLFPSLVGLDLAHNGLRDPSLEKFQGKLETVDLQSNEIASFGAILTLFPKTTSLNLADNSMRMFESLQLAQHPLQHLNLTGNSIGAMSNLTPLNALRQLDSLQLTMPGSSDLATIERLQVVHYLPHLKTLNRTTITAAERFDAERLFRPQPQHSVDKLGNHLVQITFLLAGEVHLEKKGLVTQSIRDLKALYARLARMRPSRIQSLVGQTKTSTIVLDDDSAPLSQYIATGDACRISAKFT